MRAAEAAHGGACWRSMSTKGFFRVGRPKAQAFCAPGTGSGAHADFTCLHEQRLTVPVDLFRKNSGGKRDFSGVNVINQIKFSLMGAFAWCAAVPGTPPALLANGLWAFRGENSLKYIIYGDHAYVTNSLRDPWHHAQPLSAQAIE